jgi:addiction module HigA family antidote
MTDNLLHNTRPGEVLREEFMKPLGLTAYRIAKDIDVPITRIDRILSGNRSITPDTAIRLGLYFKTGPEFWLNLQSHYDLTEAKLHGSSLSIQPCKALQAA